MRKRQIKLTESKILEAINDVLTDYENGEDGLYGSAREAIKNKTGFERWFSTKALPAGIDKEEALNLYTNAKRDLELLQYTNSKYSTDKQDELPDFNQNIYDFDNGRYAMLAQRRDNNDGGIDRAVGKSKRPTHRQTRSEIDKYFMDDSRFDDIINEAIEKFTYQDTDDEESEMFDTGLDNEPKYRVKWLIKRQDYTTGDYKTVSDEIVECDSEEEAKQVFTKVKNEYKGYYALYVTIEKEVDTLTGKRWERVLHMDGKTL